MKLWRYGTALEVLGDRYRLDGILGSGGMADVCSAWDEADERRVAIKVLKTEELDQEMLSRFVKEAGQMVHWQHPNILSVYDHMRFETIRTAGKDMVLYYIVMEFAAGGDLQKRMKTGEPYASLSAAVTIFRQVCAAVQYAHKQGVIHRDIKPLNVLFRQNRTGPEEAVLSDFGLAVQTDATHQTFAHAGTLAYMAPEQLHGHAQPASDIFALGVTLYQLLTGEFPFDRNMKNMQYALTGREPTPHPPSALNPDLPPALVIRFSTPCKHALKTAPGVRQRFGTSLQRSSQTPNSHQKYNHSTRGYPLQFHSLFPCLPQR
jgi:serine/threonine-protein kinase